MQLAEDEDRETEDDLDEEDEEYDSGGSGVAMTPPGGQFLKSYKSYHHNVIFFRQSWRWKTSSSKKEFCCWGVDRPRKGYICNSQSGIDHDLEVVF